MSKVDLIGLTKPSAITGCASANELVAWCARVSNPSNQSNTQTASKLVKYLIKHNHWSPLEMVHVVMRITTTRDIARQILRHRSFSFQEYSQRYADPTKDLNFIKREARLQDQANRQNSIELGDEKRSLQEEWSVIQQEVINASLNAYKWAIDRGIAKEQARSVLPEGNTESVVIVAGSLRSWVHYIDLRRDVATQKEHREVATECMHIISYHFPEVATVMGWKQREDI